MRQNHLVPLFRFGLTTALAAMSVCCCGGIATDPTPTCQRFEPEVAIGSVATKGTDTYDAFGVLFTIPTTGELVSIVREGMTHAQDRGVIVLERSSDGGQTWSERRTLFSHPTLDSRNVAGSVLPSGALLIFWNRYDFPTLHSDAVYFSRSKDAGWT